MSFFHVIACNALLVLSASHATAALVIHDMRFFLKGTQTPTIVNGGIADPGRNTLTFGAIGLPIESLVLSGSFDVSVWIDDATDTPVSMIFSSDFEPSIIAAGAVNYLVPGSGYVHVGEQVDPIPNAPAGDPQFTASGNAGGSIVGASIANIYPDGSFDAPSQLLFVTSGEYIASGFVATAFVIPADQLLDAAFNPLFLNPGNRDDSWISIRPTSTGYAGELELNFTGTFAHLIISASTVPEPGGGLMFACVVGATTISRRRQRR